ncbi:hypothetical protein [Chengkuizengella axinellae]|uniref:Phage tail tape measure protein n=1 Tax=Chengkuizengella axinellae TaxID=3064388 RepID=A0ABT9IYC9_9BACL|nr:hypothetical protein [Chengkuizengella sp. 2205SS18-9]MDP5274356.1 hypothetical protein [Chengkuizengella sp. 2205SS18-9]
MATDVGAIKAKLELDAQNFKTGIEKSKTEMKTMSEEVKKSRRDFQQLSKSLMDVGLGGREVRKIQTELRTTNPQILEKQLKLVEAQLRRVGADSKQIEKVKREIMDTQKETKKTEERFRGLETALAAMGTGYALQGMLRVINTLSNEAAQLAVSYEGLIEVSKALNHDTDTVTNAMDDLVARGFMSVQEASDALKTALATGYTLDESINLINALSDAAAYNRESHFAWGEAVVQAIRGIKSGNSTLTDAAGITTNLSVMYDRYAKTIGKSAATLTDAEKAQAAYNGMLEDGALFAGNADKAMEGYAGSQATFNQSLAMARAELGEAYMPVLQDIMETLKPIIKSFSEWTSENKATIASLTAGVVTVTALTAALTGLVTVVAILRAAFISLNIAMGPIGWTIAAISFLGITAGTLAYKSAADDTSESVWKFAKSQEELNQKLKESPLNNSAQNVKAMQEDIETINKLLEERAGLESEIAKEESKLIDQRNLEVIGDAYEQIEELDGLLSELGIDTPDEAQKTVERLTKAVEDSVHAILELKGAEIQQTASQARHVDEMKNLISTYDELTEKESLSSDQKQELRSVVEQLKDEYPTLLAQLDEEGKLHITNKDAIDELVDAEETMFKKKSEGLLNELEVMRTTTNEKLKLIRKQIFANQLLLESQPTTSDGLNLVLGLQQDQLSPEDRDNILIQQQKLKAEKDEVLNALAEIDKTIYSINSEDYLKLPEEDKKETKKTAGKSQSEIEADLRASNFQSSLSTTRYVSEMYNQTEEQQIEALEKLKTNHAKYLSENIDDERMIDLEIKRLKDESYEESFRNSVQWIERETYFKRLSLDEQLAAWQRVMERYEQGTEEREQAERELFRVEQEINDERIREAEEVERERVKTIEDSTDQVLRNIRKQEQAELDAIDRKRDKINDYYDEVFNEMDEEEYEYERKNLVDEIEKYSQSTSKEGMEKYADLKEQLRKLDLDEEKRLLRLERDEKLDSLDDQRRDVERHYDDLEDAFLRYVDDIKNGEVDLQDDRLDIYADGNKNILDDLEDFVKEYNDTLRDLEDTPSKPSSSKDDDDWDHYEDKYGPVRDTPRNPRTNPKKGGGKKYHTGGIGGIQNFRFGDRLLPNELHAIIEQGETILQPKQVSQLVNTLGDKQASKTVNNYYDSLIRHDGDVKLEDQADIQTYFNEQQLAAQRLKAGGDR